MSRLRKQPGTGLLEANWPALHIAMIDLGAAEE
jgi:hypothetical protein